MPKSNEREYRRMAALQTRKAEELGESGYQVEGYATTFEEPYILYEYGGETVSEVIDQDAFEGCDMTDVIFQYDHSGMVYARNKNGSLKLETDEHGLKVWADLGLTMESRGLFDAISKGLVTEMSFSFTVAEDDWDEETKTSRILKIKKLYDVSAVQFRPTPERKYRRSAKPSWTERSRGRNRRELRKRRPGAG